MHFSGSCKAPFTAPSDTRLLWLLLFLACLLFTACGNPETPAAASPTASENDALAALLAPNEEAIPYPIYATFDEMADLFEQEDDKTYVINFWATWCGPCVEEMEYFERLGETADESVQIIMVSLDFKKDLRSKLLKFVEERELKLPVVALGDINYNNWIDRVDPEWEGAIPYTLAYRGDQRIHHAVKFNSYEELENFVARVD